MTPDQREAELRRRDARFRALDAMDRVTLSAQTYGHLADVSFLLHIIDDLRTTLSHTPTRATRALVAMPATTVLPAAPSIPEPPTRSDLPWSDPANRG